MTPWITEPGHYDLTEVDYHRDPVVGGSLSSSGARTLVNETPLHFRYQRDHPRPPKKEFDFGHAAHLVVTGSGSPIIEVPHDSWRTNASKDAAAAARAQGGTPLLTHDVEHVEAMAEVLRRHPVAGPLLMREGLGEQSFVARDPESGVMCRIRVDWMPKVAAGERLILVDYKSAADADPRHFPASMGRWGYHCQGPFYIDVLHWLGLTAGPDGAPIEPLFLLVAQEKEPPYAVSLDRPDDTAVEWGRVVNRKARDLFRQCQETGQWPGYEARVHDLSLPGWQLRNYEIAEAAGHFDTASDIEESLA